MPLVVIDATHKHRQLRAEVNGNFQREAVAQRMQHGCQCMPGDVTVGAELGHDLVEPCVRGLKSLVEDVEAGRAHDLLPCRQRACKAPRACVARFA